MRILVVHAWLRGNLGDVLQLSVLLSTLRELRPDALDLAGYPARPAEATAEVVAVADHYVADPFTWYRRYRQRSSRRRSSIRCGEGGAQGFSRATMRSSARRALPGELRRPGPERLERHRSRPRPRPARHSLEPLDRSPGLPRPRRGRRATACVAREPSTHAYLREHGVPCSLSADLAFLYPYREPASPEPVAPPYRLIFLRSNNLAARTLRLDGGALFEGSRLIVEASTEPIVLATSDLRRDDRFLTLVSQRLGLPWVGCRTVPELVQLVDGSSRVVSDRYHPADLRRVARQAGAGAAQPRAAQDARPHGPAGRSFSGGTEGTRAGRIGHRTQRAAERRVNENPLDRPVRVLSLYPSFWPRQGGGQMVLAAIAQGLSPRIENTVLTRRFQDTPARQEYDYLSVHRYPNPAPEAWKDYATGARHVSFLKKLVVTGFDVLCSLAPLAEAGGRIRSGARALPAAARAERAHGAAVRAPAPRRHRPRQRGRLRAAARDGAADARGPDARRRSRQRQPRSRRTLGAGHEGAQRHRDPQRHRRRDVSTGTGHRHLGDARLDLSSRAPQERPHPHRGRRRARARRRRLDADHRRHRTGAGADRTALPAVGRLRAVRRVHRRSPQAHAAVRVGRVRAAFDT